MNTHTVSYMTHNVMETVSAANRFIITQRVFANFYQWQHYRVDATHRGINSTVGRDDEIMHVDIVQSLAVDHACDLAIDSLHGACNEEARYTTEKATHEKLGKLFKGSKWRPPG